MSRHASRHRRNGAMMGLSVAATLFGLGWLGAILFTLLWKGLAGLNLAVFTQMTPPPGSAGGLLNAIVGSLILTFIAVAIGAPIGLLAGTYMAEYGRYAKLTKIVRFINDILLSALPRSSSASSSMKCSWSRWDISPGSRALSLSRSWSFPSW